jgi:hypothetical protein
MDLISLEQHRMKQDAKHVRKINPEKMPVLSMKGSVGSLSLFSSSVYRLCFGRAHMIKVTRIGAKNPIKTIREGVAVQSLKKHTTTPKKAKIQMARVPLPIPRTRPLYISTLPVATWPDVEVGASASVEV